MKKLIIEVPTGYDDVVAVTLIGSYDGTRKNITNVSTCAVNLHDYNHLSFDEDGIPIMECKFAKDKENKIDIGTRKLFEEEKEYLIDQAEKYYTAGNTTKCACRMTIRHWLADIDKRIELDQEHKLMDELNELWEAKENQ